MTAVGNVLSETDAMMSHVSRKIDHRPFSRILAAAAITLTALVAITGCVPAIPPATTLTVDITCPGDGTVGAPVTVTATANIASATIEFTTTSGTITDGGGGQTSLTVDNAGMVTVTASATGGSQTATDTCTIDVSAAPEPEPLSVALTCPTDPVINTDFPAVISATANRDDVDLDFDFTVANVTLDTTRDETVSSDDGTATINEQSQGPHEIVVDVSVTLDDATATDTCTFNFVFPQGTILADPVERVPYASACAQDVVNCTTSFPTADIQVEALIGQEVTETDDPIGFIVQGVDGDGFEVVQFRGSASSPGTGPMQLFSSWSTGATDDNPCTLDPGAEFSNEADVAIAMQTGIHYVRLFVRNEQVRDAEESGVAECGTIAADFKSDFLEVVVDVRD